MGVYIKGMEMPDSCEDCPFYVEAMPEFEWDDWCHALQRTLGRGTEKDIDGYDCPLVPVPPHGDLIDRDALIKDGWLNLHKEVIRMGGYAIHELPLKNPSIPVIIPASKEGEG